MPTPETEAQLLRRRADEDQREAIRALIAHTQQLDQRQTRLETALADIANYVIRSEQTYQNMQQQIIALIEAQTRTSQQVVGHMEAEEHVWELIKTTSEKLSGIESAVSHISGSATGQIDNLKVAVGAMVVTALGFAGYVMTRLHP